MLPRPHRRVNCSEYFPLFLATLWVAGIFFHEGLDVGRGARIGAWGSPQRRAQLSRPRRPLPCPRCGGAVWPGLPVRAPPLLPGLRALCAAKVRSGAGWLPGGPPGLGGDGRGR